MVRLALVCLLFSCTSPREKRGDWMEHLDGRTYEPINWWGRRGAWYRNYRTKEELEEAWRVLHEEAIQNCIERGADS